MIKSINLKIKIKIKINFKSGNITKIEIYFNFEFYFSEKIENRLNRFLKNTQNSFKEGGRKFYVLIIDSSYLYTLFLYIISWLMFISKFLEFIYLGLKWKFGIFAGKKILYLSRDIIKRKIYYQGCY